MKSKLHVPAAILLFLTFSLACSLAQQVPGATAQPAPQPATQPVFDPQTGLPIASAPEWKDPNWKDPDIVLKNVFFDNLPLSEVAHELSDQFKDQFDILLPGATTGVGNYGNQTVAAAWQIDWRGEQIQLRLKDVTASELFAAMNMLFENNRTPLRWELKVNGHRQIAFLRVLVDPTPNGAALPNPEVERRVYFVGNLIGDEKAGGMTMEQIIKTITDVWQMADASGGNIQFHKEAQLLVVTGSRNQIDFMQQTLSALSDKVGLGREEAQAKAKAEEKKVEEKKAGVNAPK